MSDFAQIDENNIVTQVVVTDTNDPAGDKGHSWLVNNLGGRWIETGFDIRKNFAGIGYTYDEARDAFIAPKPFPSWVLNEDTCQWEAPSSYPDDGLSYYWNEEEQRWVVLGN